MTEHQIEGLLEDLFSSSWFDWFRSHGHPELGPTTHNYDNSIIWC